MTSILPSTWVAGAVAPVDTRICLQRHPRSRCLLATSHMVRPFRAARIETEANQVHRSHGGTDRRYIQQCRQGCFLSLGLRSRNWKAERLWIRRISRLRFVKNKIRAYRAAEADTARLLDSAASAVRNLNDFEIMNRKLRVDFSNDGGDDDNVSSSLHGFLITVAHKPTSRRLPRAIKHRFPRTETIHHHQSWRLLRTLPFRLSQLVQIFHLGSPVPMPYHAL